MGCVGKCAGDRCPLEGGDSGPGPASLAGALRSPQPRSTLACGSERFAWSEVLKKAVALETRMLNR